MTSPAQDQHAAVIAAADDHGSLTGLVIDAIANLTGIQPFHLRDALRESGTWQYPRFHRHGCNWVTERGTLCARTGHSAWPAGMPLCSQHIHSFRAEVANWIEQGRGSSTDWLLDALQRRAEEDPGVGAAIRAAFGTSPTEVHDALQAVWS